MKIKVCVMGLGYVGLPLSIELSKHFPFIGFDISKARVSQLNRQIDINNEFKLLYLLGSDNLEIKKNNEFIVYQGSHGDRGAEIADLVLPSAAFTEQNGLYENLEGRIQECKKASYPIGEALEDWKIFNLILKKIGKNDDLINFEFLRKEVLSLIPNFTKLNELPSFNEAKVNNVSTSFIDEQIIIKELDIFILILYRELLKQ